MAFEEVVSIHGFSSYVTKILLEISLDQYESRIHEKNTYTNISKIPRYIIKQTNISLICKNSNENYVTVISTPYG